MDKRETKDLLLVFLLGAVLLAWTLAFVVLVIRVSPPTVVAPVDPKMPSVFYVESSANAGPVSRIFDERLFDFPDLVGAVYWEYSLDLEYRRLVAFSSRVIREEILLDIRLRSTREAEYRDLLQAHQKNQCMAVTRGQLRPGSSLEVSMARSFVEEIATCPVYEAEELSGYISMGFSKTLPEKELRKVNEGMRGMARAIARVRAGKYGKEDV